MLANYNNILPKIAEVLFRIFIFKFLYMF